MKEQQKKYELTGEFIEHWNGKKLYRIKALVTFGAVVAGQLGGFVESEKNLDQSLSGDAWVSGNARVSGNAQVYGDAQVSGNARVRSYAVISERKMIFWASNVGSENGTLVGLKMMLYLAHVSKKSLSENLMTLVILPLVFPLIPEIHKPSPRR